MLCEKAIYSGAWVLQNIYNENKSYTASWVLQVNLCSGYWTGDYTVNVKLAVFNVPLTRG